MKTCYTIELTPTKIAIADLSPPGEHNSVPGWTINRINVPYGNGNFRGRGYGSQLLHMICNDADNAQPPQSLYLEPLATGPLDRDALIAWYERCGFRQWKYGYLRRRPQPTTHANRTVQQQT